MHLCLKLLYSSQEACVLVVTRAKSLALFIANWLGQRMERVVDSQSMLERVHFMYMPD